ncbi:MAG: hypothetical protein ABWY06_19450 [Pseudomonas sp.]|uniref:hypothetical protein n=1 Tax=Pseudomonas sp. TaxID=306 RepID=UPI0033992B0B
MNLDGSSTRAMARSLIPRMAGVSILAPGTAATFVALIACALACLSMALQVPGQVSMDSSIQLYEAFTGQSISFNPPFMSALLRWLGGGSVATALLVLINTGLLYGGFALAAFSIAQWRTARGLGHLPAWRVVLAAAVVLNPLVFLYAGIVWKDVLFASLLSAGGAFTIAASVGSVYRRALCGLAALMLLSAALLTRQQGVFMVPIMVLAVIAALWPARRRQGICISIAVIAVFLAMVTTLQHQVETSIKPPATDGTTLGLRSLMTFDLAGMVSHSPRPADEYVLPITQAQLSAVRAVYTPERVDTLSHTPIVQAWTGRLTHEEMKSAWWAMLKQNPNAYLAHRIAVFSKLMGLDGIEGTLPIHIGIEGNAGYLRQIGMEEGRTQRTQLIYDLARYHFSSPIYRHAFWLAMLGVIMICGACARLPKRLSVIGILIAIATLTMYASYLPTAIAADFRYLFGAIPLVMLLALIVLLGGTRQPAAGLAEPRQVGL